MFSYFLEYCAEIYDSEKDERNYEDPTIFTPPYKFSFLLEYRRIKNNYGFAEICGKIPLFSKECEFGEKLSNFPMPIAGFIKENEKTILEMGEIYGEEYIQLLYQFKNGYNINTIRKRNFFIELNNDKIKYLKVDNHVSHFLTFSVL